MTAFTTAQVAKILEIPTTRIRACVRAGLLAPQRGAGRRLEFSFQDLLLLKTTKDLLDARIPVPRIRRMLVSLRRQLPDDPHLTRLTIFADGRRVVAWDGTARWQPDSGQFLFNFDVRDVAESVPVAKSVPAAKNGPAAQSGPAAARPSRATRPALTAREWFNLALELEAYSPEEARQAYREALDLNPNLSDAHLNLGRLYHEGDDLDRAESHYRSAAELAPRDPVPWFNLGVLHDDMGRRDDAIRAYRRTVELEPDFADAHYNLGLLYDAMGRRAETITHLRRARALYGRPGTRS